MGVGVLSLISAGFIDARVSNDLDRLDRLGEGAEKRQLQEDIKGRQNAGQAFLWTGVVTLLGGGALFASEYFTDDNDVAVQFHLSTDTAAISAHTSF